ncbi:hypothetical protein GCM10011578_070040 [Streptomyces fuscichromogenes]|uniref:Uncharacterized protein n=1 Tax=Streptomyces fuscichromogenes TaxID=1324013 RepID=A0A918CUX7_9ACTN|nr:hypothetical protein [Streptomyces fuscichromogenes]GGN31833.1 hypothetical protein GCM10011578_070040 [Streptomyces fuscichromogenes]
MPPPHTASWITAPFCEEPQATSMQRPVERIVPSERRSHFCQFLPLRFQIAGGEPSALVIVAVTVASVPVVLCWELPPEDAFSGA